MGIQTLARWVEGTFGGQSRVRQGGLSDCKGQSRRRAAEMERHGDCREQRDGEHGHRRSRAGAAEVQHGDVASSLI
jgi:hypothetical protein